MKVIQAPNRVTNWDKLTVFLAGSIEMGSAEDWQKEAIQYFDQLVKPEDISRFAILNPRRDDWDSSWEQRFEDPNFSQQVKWELECLERCDWILMYFAPGTESKISLLELGSFRHKSIVVVCPEGYSRKGNVDIFCDRYNIPQKKTIRKAVKYIIKSNT